MKEMPQYHFKQAGSVCHTPPQYVSLQELLDLASTAVAGRPIGYPAFIVHLVSPGGSP